jgi:hypothetical protein
MSYYICHLFSIFYSGNVTSHLTKYTGYTGFSNDTPREYFCNLGPDGRRRDADERPELCRGSVEFVATKEFLV